MKKALILFTILIASLATLAQSQGRRLKVQLRDIQDDTKLILDDQEKIPTKLHFNTKEYKLKPELESSYINNNQPEIANLHWNNKVYKLHKNEPTHNGLHRIHGKGLNINNSNNSCMIENKHL